MLLPHVHVDAATSFDEAGFHGTILPVGDGSIAIVGSGEEQIDGLRDQLAESVEWSL